MGALYSDLFTFLSTSNWHDCFSSFLDTALCNLGVGYGFAWYGLAPGCNYIFTGLFSVYLEFRQKGTRI